MTKEERFFSKSIADIRTIIKDSNITEGVRQISTTSKFNHIFGTSFKDKDLIIHRSDWGSVKYMMLHVLVKIPDLKSVYYKIGFKNKYVGNNCYSISVSGISLSSDSYDDRIIIDTATLPESNEIVEIKLPTISMKGFKSPMSSLYDELRKIITDKDPFINELKNSISSGSILSMISKYIRTTNTDYDNRVDRISYHFINNNTLSLGLEDFIAAYSATTYCDGSFTSFMNLEELNEFNDFKERLAEASRIVDELKPKIESAIRETNLLENILEEFCKEKNELMSNLIDKYRTTYNLSDRAMNELLVRSGSGFNCLY